MKKLIEPYYFQNPKGAYIICQSQEEIDATLKHLHEMGFLWLSGENLWPLAQDTPRFSKPEKLRKLRKDYPKFFDFLSDCQAERDDEVIDTRVIAIGVPPVGTSGHGDLLSCGYVVGYERVYDYHYQSPWFLRSERILYKNCIWPASDAYTPAEALNYGDEN